MSDNDKIQAAIDAAMSAPTPKEPAPAPPVDANVDAGAVPAPEQ